MRKISVFLMLILLMANITVSAEIPITVTYNNNILVCDVAPYIENSRTLIPVRMAEQLGYKVIWDGETRKVSLEKAGKRIELKIDSNIATVNEKSVTMDVPAKITQDRTFVPVRFVSENFGYTVKWENSARTVIISDPESLYITNITTEKTADELLIKLFSGGTIETAEPFKLEEPLRYVYDIPNSVLDISAGEIPVNSEIISKIKYAQFSASPNVVRVVVELNKDTSVVSGYKDGIFTISVLDGGVPTVTSLKLTENNNTATVALDMDMNVNYKTYKLSNPSRFIIELPDSDIATPNIKGNGEIIESAELARKDGTTSLIIKLAGAVSSTKCSVTQNQGTIKITVNKVFTPVSDEEFLIVIDPGHGGDEPGSLGVIDGKTVLYEKDINLKIGKRVYELLLERGYNVIATRTDDSTVSLQKRVEIANESNASLFVSVHNNSFEDSTAQGTLTMYAYDTPKPGQFFSGKQIASIIQPYLVTATGGYDRKLMENSKIYVNAKTNMPAVLCECLFMSNPEDLSKLMDDSYAERIAIGIADGVSEAANRMKQ